MISCFRGRNDDGKSSTAGFLAGMAGAVPPLHEIAKNVGVELPTYLGKLNPASPGDKSATHQEQSADH